MEESYLHKKFKKKYVIFESQEDAKQSKVSKFSTKVNSIIDEGFSDDNAPSSATSNSTISEDTLNLSTLLSSSSSPSDVDYRRKSSSILQKNDNFFNISKPIFNSTVTSSSISSLGTGQVTTTCSRPLNVPIMAVVSTSSNFTKSWSHVKRPRNIEKCSSDLSIINTINITDKDDEQRFFKRRKSDESSCLSVHHVNTTNQLTDIQNGNLETLSKPYKPKFHNKNYSDDVQLDSFPYRKHDYEEPLNLSVRHQDQYLKNFTGTSYVLNENENGQLPFEKGSLELYRSEMVTMLGTNRCSDLNMGRFVMESSLQTGRQMCKKDDVYMNDNIRLATADEFIQTEHSPEPETVLQSDILDFSQRAARLLIPKVKQIVPVSLKCSTVSVISCLQSSSVAESSSYSTLKPPVQYAPNNEMPCTPINVLINNRWVRYLPGEPSPVLHENNPLQITIQSGNLVINKQNDHQHDKKQLKPCRPSSFAICMRSDKVFQRNLNYPETPNGSKQCCLIINGHYFSYLSFKVAPKTSYCTMNKTQPIYGEHDKKLSMYSEWRQQRDNFDFLLYSNVDFNQRDRRYTIAGKMSANILVHSSYKSHAPPLQSVPLIPHHHHLCHNFGSIKSENDDQSDRSQNECDNDNTNDYTYVRGRGRGKYVCDQCGIRCKKPSILKKHIRTHSDDRPFTCRSCDYSFKTKGNLTKHMKSKAHFEKFKDHDSSSNSVKNGNLSSTESDESDVDADADSSDESTRIKEHEAVHCLLNLAKSNKIPQNISESSVINRDHINSHLTYPASVSSADNRQSSHAAQKNIDVSFNPKLNIAKRFESSVKDFSIVSRGFASHEIVGNYVKKPAMKPIYGDNSQSDHSAIQTLADVAAKQIKIEKNVGAKSVATEYLKITAKHDFIRHVSNEQQHGHNQQPRQSSQTIFSHLVTNKLEENKSCSICFKTFNKPSQLTLHMNIHYFERPFRCETCSKRFRSKGHLQKHERSASHNTKLTVSPPLSTSEPRPFKCTDCNIAFRIHGHLAKHLRSKMHIMKLECLSKIPFGLYTELERSNRLLTEINTVDSQQCLESLKNLAMKVFMNDPIKLNQIRSQSDVGDEEGRSSEVI